MKKLLTAVVFLLISTALFAQSNSALVSQNGDSNEGNVTQAGSSNLAEVNQFDGDENLADVNQNGSSNEVYLAQGMTTGYWGLTTTAMSGNRNQADIDQLGTGNLVDDFVQVGDDNFASVDQEGNNNTAYVYQGWAYGFWGETATTSALSSYNSTVSITQVKDNNYGAVWQYGGLDNDVIIDQDGFSNIASIAQGFIYEDGAYDFTYPVYNTENNYASITQLGDDNVAKLFQLGDDNSFTLTQNGAGNTVGYDAGVTGLVPKRNAYFAQDGDFNTFTGVQNDGATLDIASYQFGDDNNIDLIQGEGDVALIQQNGDLNTANVYQYGVDNNASVVQTGNSNTANVSQSN
ncbi:MAG: hypothetical protein DRQ40_10360 [Gammaproteobacteria bacterium]|nr:MAG: hypothetical protein DRQ40_10360 [Gammaproteobacteria bacterium]